MRIAAVVLSLCFSLPAVASSPDAWETFRQEVETACLALAEPVFEQAAAVVDPYGSESYGMALIHGKAKGADVQIEAVCVFDKQKKIAEIGGELPVRD